MLFGCALVLVLMMVCLQGLGSSPCLPGQAMAPKGRRAKAHGAELGFKAQAFAPATAVEAKESAGGDSAAGPEELSTICYNMYVHTRWHARYV